MADWLLLRLPRTPAQPATWLVVDPRGTPAGPPQSGPLSLAAPRTAGRRICVLVPGNDVLLAEPEVPTKAGTKLAQVVPYALEEQLAEDIDELHFAIGKRAPDSSRTPVAVVARTLLDEWLTLLKSSGIEPEAMYADSDLLPVNPGQSVALLEEDVVVVRPPGGSPVTLPADALDEALEIAQSSPVAGGAGRGGAAGALRRHQDPTAHRRPAVAVRTAAPAGLSDQSAAGNVCAHHLARGGLACLAGCRDPARRPRRAACRRQGGGAEHAQAQRAQARCFHQRCVPCGHAWSADHGRPAAAHGEAARGCRGARQRGRAAPGPGGARSSPCERADDGDPGAEFPRRDPGDAALGPRRHDRGSRHPVAQG